MKKRLIAAALLVGLATGANAQVGEKPHHEPLVAVKPPKPNIMMVLDTSGSMRGFDMSMPKGYDPEVFKDSTYYKGWNGDRVNYYKPNSWRQQYSRLAVMQHVVLGLLEKYRYQAYMGLAPLDYDNNGTYSGLWDKQSYEDLFYPPADLTADRDYERIRKHLLRFPFDQNTPLNSPLYRASVIMRGQHQNFDSPVRYRCQQQHIILMTDGEQNSFAIKSTANLKNGFKRISPILQSDLNRGLKTGSHGGNQSRPTILSTTATLENIGKLFSKIDMMKETKHKRDVDEAGIEWLDGGNSREPIPIVAHGVRFSAGAKNEDKHLQALADATGGVAVGADNTEELERGFHKIFQTIISSRSGTGSYEDQGGRTEDSIRYATYYDPFNWSGKIVARQFQKDNTSAKGQFSKEVWSTDDTIKPNQGLFYTLYNGKQTTLDELSTQVMTPSDKRWFKGDTSGLGLEYRAREVPLGDIIDSHLQYSAKDKININLNTLAPELAKKFENDYLIPKNRSTKNYNYLIAGSNDGFVNVVYGEKTSNNQANRGGERAVAYYPGFFANREKVDQFSKDPYTHSYGVNGTTHLFDARVGNAYKSLAITSMGAGHRGLVGYQLYERAGASENSNFKINFEITNKTQGYSELGYTYSGVEFLNRLNGSTPQALAVFGNGYTFDQGANAPSVLYISDAVTGDLVKKIELPGGRGGASTPAVVVKKDPYSDYQVIDRIYVGDQSGKLFKILFDTTSEAKIRTMEVAKVIPLFDANEPEGNGNAELLPITVQPILTVDKRYNKYWIYFGTGRAILKQDADSTANHYFYGIKDEDKTVSKKDLVTQHTVERVKDSSGLLQENTDFLEVSDYQATLTSNGWRFRIVEPGKTGDTGERIILPAAFYQENNEVKAVVFTTYGVILDEKLRNDPCSTGGHFGQTLFLSPFTGGSSKMVNGAKPDEAYSGIFSQGSAIGMPTGPGILTGNSFAGNQFNDYSPELITKLQSDNPKGSHTEQDADLGCYLTYTGVDGKDGLIPVSCKYEPARDNERIYLHKVI